VVTVFRFLCVWEEMSREEKDYLIENFQYSKYGPIVEKTNKIEDSLISKGVIEADFYYRKEEYQISISDGFVWIFEGLRITSRIG